MGRAIKILMVEDNPFDAELIVATLKRGGFEPVFARVDNRSDMQEALAHASWDLVTCDHSMPEFSAPEALELLKELGIEIPVIIVSGEIDLSLAVALLKKGAWDYVHKGDLDRLPVSIERELENALLLRQRQTAEKALQESEKNLRLLFENSYDAMMIHDLKGKIREVNPACLKLYGVSREEAIQGCLEDYVGLKVNFESVKQIWARTMEGDEGLYDMKARRPGDGMVFDIEVGIKKIFWQGENMVLAAVRDVSERKLLEQKLREQEEINRLVTDNMRDTVWIMDMNFGISWISPSVVRTRGFSLEELKSMSMDRHLAPESLARSVQDMVAVLTPERLADPHDEIVFSSEYEYIKKDGSTFWADTVVTLLRDEEGKPTGMLMVGRDVTARKEAEQALHDREALLQALVENLPLDFWVRNNEGRIVLQSKQGQKSWGVMEGHTLEELALDTELAQRWNSNYKRALNGEIINEENKYRVEGQEKNLQAFLAPILDRGSVHGVVGANIDLSELRQAESELHALQDRFGIIKAKPDFLHDEDDYIKLYENMAEFVYILDPGGRFRMINRMGCEIIGYSAEEARELILQDVICPEDYEYLNTQVWAELREKGICRHPVKVLTKKGEIRSLDCMASLIYGHNESGFLIGIARDMTEQNDMRRQLQESEEKFRAFAENSTAWMFIIQDDRFIYVNSAFMQGSGYDEPELLSINFWDIVHPDFKVLVKERGQARLNGENVPPDYDIKMITKDGAALWINIRVGSMILNARPASMATAFDISERKAMEEQLLKANQELEGTVAEMRRLQDETDRQILVLENQDLALQASEEQYKSLVELIPQGVYQMNLNGDITYANRNALQMFGYTDEDLLKRINIKDIFLPREYERSQARVKTLLDGTGQTGSEYLCKRKDGSLFYTLAYMAPVFENGEPRYMQGTILDIDERKRIENEIMRLNNELEVRVEMRTRELEAANRELEAFSYMASHDLRAPLRAIDGFAGILSRELGDNTNAEVNHLLEVIHRNVEKMRLLIDDLLKFSKVNRQSISLVNVNMQQLVEEVCQEVQSYEPDRTVQWDVIGLHEAQCDRGLIRQVFLNLCSNAWKFTRMNSDARISVFSRQEADEIIYTIRDNGVGFNMKYYERLFNVFQRLHSQADFDGTGIGLAIVQRIVNRHGGRVWAESEPHIGAQFHFSLPVPREEFAASLPL